MRKKITSIQNSLVKKNLHKTEKLVLIVPVIYIVIVSVVMIYHRAWFSPDQFFAFAILGIILIGRIRQFLQDWIPMMLLLFGYEYLRGLVPNLVKQAHIFPLINADTKMFGFLPTIKLQTLLFNPTSLHWYDYMAVILYISHFIIPMLIALIFWLYDRKHFKKYTSAFIVLSYLAFVTFIIFPAVPPWMASNQGYIPPLAKIMDQVMGSFAHPIDVPSIYQFFGANLVAAFPSLHAAYPWLIFLFIMSKSKFLGLLSLLYVGGVWFSVIYLGEHYVIDVLGGALYSTIAFMIIQKHAAWVKKKEALSEVTA